MWDAKVHAHGKPAEGEIPDPNMNTYWIFWLWERVPWTPQMEKHYTEKAQKI